MGYNEELSRIRQKVIDAVSEGVVSDENRDFYEATLIQIMNDAERNRQTCLNSVDTLKRQIATLEGQAQAFSSFSSIIFNVLNGFIVQEQKNKADIARREQELEEIKKAQEEQNVKAKVEVSSEPLKFSGFKDLEDEDLDKSNNKVLKGRKNKQK